MKLNLGSGTRYILGFVNVDYSADVKADLKIHLGKEKLPYENESVEIIVFSHTLEHLTRTEGEFCLRECWRVLEFGGLIYLGVPDIKKITEIYFNGHKDVPQCKNNDEWLIEAIYESQTNDRLIHKYGYTEKTLNNLMLKIGFKPSDIRIEEDTWVKFEGVEAIQKRWGVYAEVWTK